MITSTPMILLDFFVAGTPVPQGSKRAWYNQITKRVMMREAQDDRLHVWRTDVMAAAVQARYFAEERVGDLTFPLDGPMSVALTFHFKRGIGHYGTGKNSRLLKPSAPDYPIKPPDIDKLTRAVFDALTVARIWLDDAQVVATTQRKRWVDRFEGSDGVRIVLGLL